VASNRTKVFISAFMHETKVLSAFFAIKESAPEKKRSSEEQKKGQKAQPLFTQVQKWRAGYARRARGLKKRSPKVLPKGRGARKKAQVGFVAKRA